MVQFQMTVKINVDDRFDPLPAAIDAKLAKAVRELINEAIENEHPVFTNLYPTTEFYYGRVVVISHGWPLK